MFKKLFIVSDAGKSKSPRATTISVNKARSMLEKELHDIRHRLSKLEQEFTNVTPLRTPPDRKAA